MSAEWTADDLPEPVSGAEYAYRDAALEWLNEHHPRPVPYDEGGITGPRLYMPLPEAWTQPPRNFSGVGWKAMYERGIEKRVEVLNRAARAERERDELREHVRNIGEGMVRAQNQRGEMRRERDEAKREGWRECALAIQDGLGAWDALEHYGRSETEPANTYRAGADPAVFVVRESDIAAIEVKQCGSQMVAGDASAAGPEQARRFAQDNLQRVAAHEAIARAIEAEQAVDPVEAKARSEADRRYSGDPNHAFIEGALWATRHLNAQEAGDE